MRISHQISCKSARKRSGSSAACICVVLRVSSSLVTRYTEVDDSLVPKEKVEWALAVSPDEDDPSGLLIHFFF